MGTGNRVIEGKEGMIGEMGEIIQYLFCHIFNMKNYFKYQLKCILIDKLMFLIIIFYENIFNIKTNKSSLTR